jgi:hypothetical protein
METCTGEASGSAKTSRRGSLVAAASSRQPDWNSGITRSPALMICPRKCDVPQTLLNEVRHGPPPALQAFSVVGMPDEGLAAPVSRC